MAFQLTADFEVTIKLPIGMVQQLRQIIDDHALPFKVSYPLANAIDRQVQEQVDAARAAYEQTIAKSDPQTSTPPRPAVESKPPAFQRKIAKAAAEAVAKPPAFKA